MRRPSMRCGGMVCLAWCFCTRRIDVLQGRKKTTARLLGLAAGRRLGCLAGASNGKSPKRGALRGLVEPRKPLCAPYSKCAVNEPEGRWSRSSATTAAHPDPPTCRPRPPGPGRGDCRADQEPSPRIWNWQSSCALKLVPVKGDVIQIALVLIGPACGNRDGQRGR